MNPTQEQLRLQMEMEAEAQEQERQQQAAKEPTPTERANMPGYTGPTIGPYTGPVKTFKSPEDLQRETEESGVLPNLALQAQKFGRGLAGGVTAGLATKLAPALQGDWESLTPEQQEQVLKEYRGDGGGLSSVGRAVGAMRTPLNQVGAALGTAGTALNQAAQAGFAGAMENRGLGETLVQSLVAGGLPVLGRALGSFLGPKMQPQKVLPEINPNLDDATRRQLTNNAYREIAVGSGMSADDADRIIRDRPELAEQTVIEFNRGRDVGAFGPVTSDPSSVIPFRFENVNPPAVADRTLEATRLAEAAKNEARQGIQMRLPTGPIQKRLDEANEALMSSAAGGQEKASRIQTLIERYRNIRARDPNAAKVQSIARARNPMQSMPEAPPPAAQAGDSGQRPTLRWVDPIAQGPNKPMVDPVKGGIAPEIKIQPEDLPTEGRIGVNPELVEPGFGTSPNVSVPVSDPTTMGRIRAAQSQARETTVPRDSMQPGAGMNEQQGFLDDIARELALGKDAAAIKDRSTDEAHRAAANALLNALEDIAGTDARLAFERAMTRGSAADDAYKAAGRLAGQGMENVRPSWAGKGAAIASSVSNPIAARWRILNQNRIADKLLARTPADPRIAQMVEWIRSASPGPAQAARFYVAAQKEPRLLEEIQNEGKEGE